MQHSLLHITKLSWEIDSQSILDDISFAVTEGDFVGLLGPNGAGKTSLLRCLYRYQQPSSGHIYFGNRDINSLSTRQLASNIAVVLQESSADFGLTVEEVVTLGLIPEQNLFGQISEQQRNRIQQALQAVAMLSHYRQNFQSLSGGEKQRVLIARAILQQPKLLILDEPTNHLDIHFQIETLNIIKKLGISVIASFHDLNLAAHFCDRILLLRGGKLMAYDTPDKVLTEKIIASVFDVSCAIDKHPFSDNNRVSFNLSSKGLENKKVDGILDPRSEQ